MWEGEGEEIIALNHLDTPINHVLILGSTRPYSILFYPRLNPPKHLHRPLLYVRELESRKITDLKPHLRTAQPSLSMDGSTEHIQGLNRYLDGIMTYGRWMSFECSL